MCGIVGVVSSEGSVGSHDRAAFFRNALIADQIRGPHSTGFFSVEKSYQGKRQPVEIVKKAFNASDFLNFKDVDKALNAFGFKQIAIGHNRWATMGGINHDTAHPFKHGAITMVHNGTLDYFYNLEGSDKFDVDSEIITYAMSRTDDPVKVLEKLEGAYALVWYDDRDGLLRIARNDERPLHLAFVKDENTMLLASEGGMLRWLAERNKQTIKNLWQLAPGKLLTFDVKDLRNFTTTNFTPAEPYYPKTSFGYNNSGTSTVSKTSKKKEVEKLPTPKTKAEIEVDEKLGKLNLYKGIEVYFEPKVFNTYDQSASSDYGYLEGFIWLSEDEKVLARSNGLKADSYSWMVNRLTIATVTNLVPDKDEPGTEVILLAPPNWTSNNIESIDEDEDEFATFEFSDSDTGEDLYIGPYGTDITKEMFDAYVADGCVMCQRKLSTAEHETIAWTTNAEPVCSHCIEDFNYINGDK